MINKELLSEVIQTLYDQTKNDNIEWTVVGNKFQTGKFLLYEDYRGGFYYNLVWNDKDITPKNQNDSRVRDLCWLVSSKWKLKKIEEVENELKDWLNIQIRGTI